MTSLAPFLQSLIREEKNVLVRNISKFIIYPYRLISTDPILATHVSARKFY